MLSLENLEQKVAEFGKTFVAPYTESIDKEAWFPKEAYDELKKQGYITISGRVSRKYFMEKVYGAE